MYLTHTNLVFLATPGLFVKKQNQAVGYSQQALWQGVVSVGLVTVQTVSQSLGFGVRLPREPLGPNAKEEGHEVVTPGNYSSRKKLKQEVCGLQRKEPIYPQFTRQNIKY